ncbi:hypothetical protein EGW08_001536 [Elysia chlorotica]|uniref:N-acetyltransferase 9-like protein n=1 Tax=Elysia chlorotica TaxID=188477 RepID=A0A433UAB7_ELYCH|nr:hypothetical protein EGW08_001536 [Elysia chlorotica]
MRDNEFVWVRGTKVLLVPYEKHHVQKYHGWMESEELRELTASERLSLEEEYDMQRKWRESPDKCTFIILARDRYELDTFEDVVQREIGAMVGDVNIFFPSEDISRDEGEVEIMIADPSVRGKGFGRESLCLMMRYARENLGTKTFTSKIGFSNAASLHLFQSLGFKEISRSDVFEEVTLQLEESATDVVFKFTENYHIESMSKSSPLVK